ncbi:uncharacterized protein F13E9.13, mitochondrial [Lingula anatina]|uniref:Uncharacterized protein F13E9.13, mitochondrial n=1 Tax=Lingula anatina TaxID=7574 RepID=A0A1S3JSF7_LINAN|nr:uncharacterized protein F13E9.13, mitochondrial [Lingula anatina]|eukprot:XP_013413298.1 uncharacterized protein F13E9.13, mitochondrial [Lingula anatina]
MNAFSSTFGRLRGVVIGMVHLRALPGTPAGTLSMQEIIEVACKEAKIYKDAGVDAVMVENMHDVPYVHSTGVGHEITASMSVVCSHVKEVCGSMPVGVQVLAGANKQAIAVALSSGLQFIRAEGFVFSHVADEGLMNACAAELLRYRKQIGASHIQVFTDIKKKHSSHSITSDISIAETAKAAEFFLSDGVIVTGAVTGASADLQEFKDVQKAVKIPVLIGSGVTVDNVEQYASANAFIIGSYFKYGGHWSNEIDPTRVAKFMEKVKLKIQTP